MHKWQNDDWGILQAQEPAPMLVSPWRGQGDMCEINRPPLWSFQNHKRIHFKFPEINFFLYFHKMAVLKYFVTQINCMLFRFCIGIKIYNTI